MKPTPDCEVVKIKDIRPDPDNAATHDAANDAAIRRLLELHGQYKPVVVDAGAHDSEKRGVIRAGNRLHFLMKEAGYQEIWVNWKSFESDLTAQAFAVADNASAELAGWNVRELASQVQAFTREGLAPKDFAFQPFEVEPLVAATFGSPGATSEERFPPVKRYRIPAAAAPPIDTILARYRGLYGGTEAEALVAICTSYQRTTE